MAAAVGTIPWLSTYQPGALAIGSTVFLEIVDSTNATTAQSWNISQQDLVGKAPSVMNYGVPTATDQVAFFQKITGLPMQCAIGDLSIPSGNLPAGGGTGTFLAKVSATSYSANWTTISNLVSPGTGLFNSGTATALVLGIATVSIVSSMIATGAIGSTQIAANAVGSAQMASGIIGTSQIVANSIGSSQMQNNAIGTAQLATSIGLTGSLSIGTVLAVGGTATLSGGMILNGTLGLTGNSVLTGTFGVVGTTLATGTFGIVGTTNITGTFVNVGTASFTGGNFNVLGTATFTGVHGVIGTTIITGTLSVIGTSNFSAVNVTGIVLVNGSVTFTSGAFSVIGTTLFTSGAFGVVGTATFTSTFGVVGTTVHTGVVNIIGTTSITGSLLLGSLATGVLVSSGTGVVSAQGGMVLLNTLLPNAIASVSDTTSFTNSAYRSFMIMLDTVCPAAQTTTFQMTLATTGSAFTTSGYVSIAQINVSSVLVTDTSTSALLISGTRATTQLQTSTVLGVSGFIKFFNPASAVNNKTMVGSLQYPTPGAIGTTTFAQSDINGVFQNASPVTGVNFLFNSGNIQTGVIKIFGIT